MEGGDTTKKEAIVIFVLVFILIASVAYLVFTVISKQEEIVVDDIQESIPVENNASERKYSEEQIEAALSISGPYGDSADDITDEDVQIRLDSVKETEETETDSGEPLATPTDTATPRTTAQVDDSEVEDNTDEDKDMVITPY